MIRIKANSVQLDLPTRTGTELGNMARNNFLLQFWGFEPKDLTLITNAQNQIREELIKKQWNFPLNAPPPQWNKNKENKNDLRILYDMGPLTLLSTEL